MIKKCPCVLAIQQGQECIKNIHPNTVIFYHKALYFVNQKTKRSVVFMFKRKDGLYQEKVIINGKNRYFYGKSKKEVLAKIRDFKEADSIGLNFEVVAEKWWEEHEKKIEYNTTKGYKPAKNRAKEHFDGIPIKDITPPQIFSYLKKFALTYADKTVKTQLSVFNMIFTYAVQEGYILFNPARDLVAPAGTGKKKRHCPSNKDINLVKKSVNCTFGLLPYMAMYTGLRKGELLALTKSDIDIKNRIIRVSKSVFHINNKPHLKKPKSEKSDSTVPILDKLLPYLKKLPNGLLFPDENGKLLTDSQYNKLFETYQKETGCNFTVHQLRHCYATMLFENDIKPEKAQALLRHAQLSTTMDIYKELRAEKKKKIYEEVYNVDI